MNMKKLLIKTLFVSFIIVMNIGELFGQQCPQDNPLRVINMSFSQQTSTFEFDLSGCGDGLYYIWVDGLLVSSGHGAPGQHISFVVS